MAQNLTWLGNSYTNVPYLELPKTGGGYAKFTDVTPTTATAEDVASGKIFITADGSQETGTASGGGGGGMDIGQATPSANLLAMLKAIYNGTAKTGTFTRTGWLTQSVTEIFDANDTTVNNFVIFAEGWSPYISDSVNRYYFMNMVWLDTGDSVHPFAFGTKECVRSNQNNTWVQYMRGDKDYTIETGTEGFNYAKWQFENGVLSVMASYNKNSTYTPFNINVTYRWIAW